MTVRTSNAKLTVIMEKGRGGFWRDEGAIELGLQSGQVDVTSNLTSRGITWRASSSASWLRLLNPIGTVHSRNTLDFVSYSVDIRGLADTSSSGPLRTQILVNSSMREGMLQDLLLNSPTT